MRRTAAYVGTTYDIANFRDDLFRHPPARSGLMTRRQPAGDSKTDHTPIYSGACEPFLLQYHPIICYISTTPPRPRQSQGGQ